MPYLASFVNSKMEEIERDYYSKEEIDNKAFIDASYIDDNCLVNEEYVYNTLQGYVKNSDLSNSVLDILNNSNLNMEVNSTPVTINGYKINLLKEGNELSLSIYTPISVAVNSTVRVQYNTNSVNVTIPFSIEGGKPPYRYIAVLDGNQYAAFQASKANAAGSYSYTLSATPNQQRLIHLYYWDEADTTRKETSITLIPTYKVVYKTSLITPVDFNGDNVIHCANKNEVAFTTTTTGDQCTYFACPTSWNPLFINNGGFATSWEVVGTYYMGIGSTVSYTTYKSNSGLGTANYTLK